MTSVAVFDAWQERAMFTGAWRRCRKLVRRVEARVSSVEARNFKFCRATDEEADRAARVPRRRSGS